MKLLESKMNRENKETNKAIRLDWDSHFFGISIGRIYAKGLTEERLRTGLERAEQENIRFVELFCDASDDQSIDSSMISYIDHHHVISFFFWIIRI